MDYTLSLLSAEAGLYPTLHTKLNKKIDGRDFLQQCVKKKWLKPVYISPSKSIWRENRISSDHSEMSRERSSPQLSLISSGIPISVFAEPSSWWRLFGKYIQEIGIIRLKLPDYLYCSQLATLIYSKRALVAKVNTKCHAFCGCLQGDNCRQRIFLLFQSHLTLFIHPGESLVIRVLHRYH